MRFKIFRNIIEIEWNLNGNLFLPSNIIINILL